MVSVPALPIALLVPIVPDVDIASLVELVASAIVDLANNHFMLIIIPQKKPQRKNAHIMDMSYT